MTPEKKQKELDILIQKAYDALSDACQYAETHDLEFTFNPASGMGGVYERGGRDSWYDSDCSDVDEEDIPYGWTPSSYSC